MAQHEITLGPAPPTITDGQVQMMKSGAALIVEAPHPEDPSIILGMHALSRHDMLSAIGNATEDAKQFAPGTVGDEKPEPPNVLLVEKCFRDQVVMRAFCQWPVRGEPEPLFDSPNDLRAKMSEPGVEALYEMYVKHEAWVCPLQRAEQVDQKLFDNLVERLKKKPDGTILTALPTPILVALVLRLVSLTTD